MIKAYLTPPNVSCGPGFVFAVRTLNVTAPLLRNFDVHTTTLITGARM